MSFLTRKTALAVLAAGLASLSLSVNVHAADLLSPPPVDDAPVTIGTGWYLRGDVALNKDSSLNLNGQNFPVNGSFPTSVSGTGGFGFKYNNWLRSDITFDYMAQRTYQATSGAIQCQVNAYKQYAGTVGTTALYNVEPVYDPYGCTNTTSVKMQNYAVLVNAYFDLGTWSGFTPYVGAGAGGSINHQATSSIWTQLSNGAVYAPSWVDPINGVTTSINWNSASSSTIFRFAWAAMGGVSYAVTPNAAVDVGYRYLDLGKMPNGAGITQDIRSHQLRIGFRYTPD